MVAVWWYNIITLSLCCMDWRNNLNTSKWHVQFAHGYHTFDLMHASRTTSYDLICVFKADKV